MKVIGHQAIGIEIERKFIFLLLEQAGELEIVIVGPEYLSTIVAASDYMYSPPAISIRGFLGMVRGCYSWNSSNVNKLKPDPALSFWKSQHSLC